MPPRSGASGPPSAKPVSKELLKATSFAARADPKAVRPTDLRRIIVDTTVRGETVAHPVDSRLLEIARGKVVPAAKLVGIALKQTLAREGKDPAAQGRRLRRQTVQAPKAQSNSSARSWASSVLRKSGANCRRRAGIASAVMRLNHCSNAPRKIHPAAQGQEQTLRPARAGSPKCISKGSSETV